MFTVTPPPSPPKYQRRPDAVRRQQALERTRKRFEGRAFEWRRNDCLVLIRYHLVGMGHRGLPKLPRYSSALGAKRALLAQGVESLSELLDKYLQPITVASMLPGDVAMLPGDPEDNDAGFDCLTISLGFKFWGWHPDQAEWAVMQVAPEAVQKAWRA